MPLTVPVTLKELSVDTLTADGTEQTVIESTSTGEFEGWIDLANMASSDTVIIKIYAKIKSGGTYRQYDSTTYTGAQTNPALHAVKLPAKYGFKVTLQQTAGINRTYDYNFFKRA